MKWNNQLIEQLQWSNTIINRAGKERVAKEVADMAKNGDIIGAAPLYCLPDFIRIGRTDTQRSAPHRDNTCFQ